MVVRLQNTIRDYAWGSTTALPQLLGVEPSGEPQAEMWMGAHESAPSVLPSGDSLYDVVSAGASDVLGAETAERFEGRFPFLAKLLAAGADADILGLKGSGTELIDLEGRFACPGLNDNHLHLISTGLVMNWVDITPEAAPTLDALLARVAQRASVTPPTQVRSGWRMSTHWRAISSRKP